MTLNEVLKNTNYDVSLFSEEARKYVEDAIVVKTIRGKESLFIKCLKRDKEIALKPEEAVRQLYLYKLIHEYGYPTSRIEVEFPIHFGREVKRADIAIMDKDRLMVPYIIVELKKPKLTDGKEQLKSYCNATGAPIGVWTNGEQISYYNRKDPNYFEPITNIPKVSEKLADIINEKFTYEDLKKIDRISQQKRSLRSLIQEMEDEVLASAGVDSFEEIFKLIFAKLYDELVCERDAGAYLKFRNAGETDFELKEKIQGLFDDAKKKWEGIFTDESKILLSPSHLAVCVATLQDKVGRDILFIERNLNFLKPGGRMAIVLPQGRFNNSSDKSIREYIAERCRILAVVGLHGNVFKPHRQAPQLFPPGHLREANDRDTCQGHGLL